MTNSRFVAALIWFSTFLLAACSGGGTQTTSQPLLPEGSRGIQEATSQIAVVNNTKPAPISLRAVMYMNRLGATTVPPTGGGGTVKIQSLPVAKGSVPPLPVPVTEAPVPQPSSTPPACHKCSCLAMLPSAAQPDCPLGTSSSNRPQAVVNTDDGGGSFGLWINNGAASGDGDMYLAMTAGTNIVVPVAPAGSPAQYNSILAPSAHAPNGDCLAVVNGYSNDVTTGGVTSELMAIYDYCDAGGKYEGAFPINSTFLANYVRVFSNGNQTPEYIVETIKGGDGAWHMIIFNETTQVWDQYYQSAPGQSANLATVGQRGWAELKTSLRGGTSCPTSSTQFGVSGIRVHLASNTWVKLDGTNSPPLYKGGSCLGSPSPYHTMTYNTADWGWYVSQV